MLIACCFRPTIRELRLEDIPPAAGLLCDAFAPPDGYNPLQRRIIVAETEAGLAARLGKSLVLVAEQDDGEIVGSVEAFTPAFLEGKAVRFWNESLPLDTYLSALAVAPGSRRSGLALALVESVEERAWSAGEGAVSLQVDELNTAAVALYRNLGYRVVGRDRAVTTPSSLNHRQVSVWSSLNHRQRPRLQPLARRRQGAQPAGAAEGATSAGAGRRRGGGDGTGAGAASALASEGQDSAGARLSDPDGRAAAAAAAERSAAAAGAAAAGPEAAMAQCLWLRDVRGLTGGGVSQLRRRGRLRGHGRRRRGVQGVPLHGQGGVPRLLRGRRMGHRGD